MNTEELSNRSYKALLILTLLGLRLLSLEEFDPSQNYLLSISDIEGYETQFIEFEIWDEKDGHIPGIKLFKDPLNEY